MSDASRNRIVGDVASTSDVRLEANGMFVTASLNRKMGSPLLKQGKFAHYTGARVDLDNGNFVILSGEPKKGNDVVVRRVGKNSVYISMSGGDVVEVDDVEAAFLRLKLNDFSRGEVELSGPMTASEWRGSIGPRLSEARRMLEKRRTDMVE